MFRNRLAPRDTFSLAEFLDAPAALSESTSPVAGAFLLVSHDAS